MQKWMGVLIAAAFMVFSPFAMAQSEPAQIDGVDAKIERSNVHGKVQLDPRDRKAIEREDAKKKMHAVHPIKPLGNSSEDGHAFHADPQAKRVSGTSASDVQSSGLHKKRRDGVQPVKDPKEIGVVPAKKNAAARQLTRKNKEEAKVNVELCRIEKSDCRSACQEMKKNCQDKRKSGECKDEFKACKMSCVDGFRDCRRLHDV